MTFPSRVARWSTAGLDPQFSEALTASRVLDVVEGVGPAWGWWVVGRVRQECGCASCARVTAMVVAEMGGEEQ